jgi:hypothetical protein
VDPTFEISRRSERRAVCVLVLLVMTSDLWEAAEHGSTVRSEIDAPKTPCIFLFCSANQ